MVMAVPNFDLAFDPSGDEHACDESTEPMAKKPRFGGKSLEEVETLIEQRVPTSTKKTTATWVKVFEEFCVSSQIHLDREEPSAHVNVLLFLHDLFSLLPYLSCRDRNRNRTTRL